MIRMSNRVSIGRVTIGGGLPPAVQSMTNTPTTDVIRTRDQIDRLQSAGCELVRLAVPDQESVRAFAEIRRQTDMPLIADIHFDYRLALGAMDAGAAKIRINPGNIARSEQLQSIARKATDCGIPIRIGVNSGSLEKELLRQEGGATVNALVASAERHIDRMRQLGVENLVLSVKSSDVCKTIACYQKIAERVDVPLHVGLTEAGTIRVGTIRSAVAIGALLAQGIGDTIRVSLTGDPVEEVFVARQILASLNLGHSGVRLIACPTCGRTKVDLIAIAEEAERQLVGVDKILTVAIMGCEVNGPGEAREADIGIACGKGSAVLFKKGKIVRRVKESRLVDELVKEVRAWNSQE
ncbi:flavodoxin-dependent (E)-4-hydroxy-3-methylbut-2-enyl-diphosphate synthase [candidate division KSB1 bacterium]|nr:flavodoxin-dependent (E)-4-hydroxy-3-methylbut-2-enyl-diphosphate synthase [candidate division KSB1 bacterium]